MAESDTPLARSDESLASPPAIGLEGLIRLQESLWQRGNRVPVERLTAERPALGSDDLLELVYNEAILREGLGETIDPKEYADRFPQLARELSLQWNVDRALLSGLPSAKGAHRQPGQPGRIGRYEVQALQGKGGMGVAFRAWDPLLKRVVIMKMLRAGVHADAEDRRRFRTEAEALARVRHPNIVQVFDVGEHEGQPFLALEFCAGGSLASLLNQKPLPPREAALVVSQIAHGVAAAHAFQIIHRDLKPSNILLAEENVAPGDSTKELLAAYGNGRAAELPLEAGYRVLTSAAAVCKVTDFGLAKQLDSIGDQTQTGALMGTPAYMAPEQAFGSIKGVGPAVDIYALGAILYECLTGRAPFQGETTAATLDQVRTRTPTAPRQLQPQIPVDLETIALKCLHKEPAQRYGSAREVADDLGRFLDRRPILARPIPWTERTRLWCRRNPRVALMVGSIALLLSLLSVGSTVAAILLKGERDAARKAEGDAVEAERARLQELYRAYLAEVRASRLTGRDGQRERGLEAIRKILSALAPEELTEEQRAELRDEALASLAYMDVRQVARCDAASLISRDAAVDDELEYIASVGATVDSTLLGKMADPQAKHRRLEGARPVPAVHLTFRGFSPNGKWLVEVVASTAQANQHRLRVRTRSGELLKDVPAPHLMWPAFHPKEPQLVAPCLDSAIHVLELPSGRELRRSPPRFREAHITLSPDGAMVAVATRHQPAEIIDSTGWNTVTSLPQAGPTRAVAWSPDGEQVVFGDCEGKLYRWLPRSKTGSLLTGKHFVEVTEIRFSPDGEFLASSSLDNTTLVRQVHGDRLLFTMPGRVIDFARDGHRLAVADGRNVAVLELVGAHAYRFERRSAAVVQFSPDGTWLIMTDGQGPRFLSANNLRADFRLGLDPCGPVAFHPNGRELITFGLFSHVWHWSFRAPESGSGSWQLGPPRKFNLPGLLGSAQWNEPQHFGREAMWSCDGQIVALADFRNNRVLLADGDLKEPPRVFASLMHLAHVAISPDRAWIAGSAAITPRVQVWDAASARCVLDVPDHESMVFSPDGRWFITALKKNIHFYRVGSWELARSMARDTLDDAAATPLAIQRSGRLLAFAAGRSRIRLCDVESGRIVANLTDPEAKSLSSLCFSPDGTRLAFCSHGGGLGIWDLHALRADLVALGLDHEGLPERTAPLPPADVHLDLVRGPDLPAPEQWSKYWLRMAEHEVSAQSFADAVHAADKALETLPEGRTLQQWADVFAIRGRFHLLNSNPNAAREDWSRILTVVPGHLEATRSLARLCLLGPLEFRDPQRAFALVAPLANCDRPEPEILTLLGIAQVRLSRFQEASTILQKVEGEAHQPLAKYFTAFAHHHLGERQAAKLACNQAREAHERQRESLTKAQAEELAHVRAEVESLLGDMGAR